MVRQQCDCQLTRCLSTVLQSQVLAAVEAFVSGGVDSMAPFAHNVSVCLVPALAVSA